MQTSTSGAGLDKATTATDDLSTQLHEDLTQLSQATEAEGAHADGNTIDAAELQQPHPVAETMAPPAATAADQTFRPDWSAAAHLRCCGRQSARNHI